jgi:hypothetical protein
MSWRERWVVLVPGEFAWVERRARELLKELEYESEIYFKVIPGQGRYQAVVQEGENDRSPEVLLATRLSLECEEPVYSISRFDFPCMYRCTGGEEEDANDTYDDQEPEALVRSLGCLLPWFDEPQLKPYKKPTRTVALIQGLSLAKVRKALEQEAGRPLPPGYYRIEETPLGVLATDGTGELVFADNRLAYRFPRATVYSVIATPSLDFFVVLVMRGRKTVEFVPPPEEATYYPAVHEIMGEREPERILAALGIPKEWFKL